MDDILTRRELFEKSFSEYCCTRWKISTLLYTWDDNEERTILNVCLENNPRVAEFTVSFDYSSEKFNFVKISLWAWNKGDIVYNQVTLPLEWAYDIKYTFRKVADLLNRIK